jgi:long-chain acyl-CoA synthetase
MNYLETIFDQLRKNPATEILSEIRGSERNGISSSRLLSEIHRARGFLASQGVRPGSRVALIGPNSIRWTALYLALLSQGAVSVPLYTRQKTSEMLGILKDCDPALILVDDSTLASELMRIWPEAPRIALFRETWGGKPFDAAVYDFKADELVTLIYTSGTSGEPKGVMLNFGNFNFMVPQASHHLEITAGPERRGEKVFHYLPFCFAGSLVMLLTHLYRGRAMILATDLTQLPAHLKAAQPRYFLNVPTLLERIRHGVVERLEKSPKFAQALYQRGLEAYDRISNGKGRRGDRLALGVARATVFRKIRRAISPKLEFLISGSAPLCKETEAWFAALGIPVYQVYGLTETTAILTMDQPSTARPGAVGPLLTGIEAKLTLEGELICRGLNIFAGYWNRPEATKEALRDGWFHTGDQAVLEEDGQWRIIGRLKDIIVPESGHNVAPEPIEDLITSNCPGLEHVFVSGHGRPFLVAIVDGSPDEAAIERSLERVNQSLPHYKRIRKFYRSPEAFSVENDLLTANQKLKRPQIEKKFHQIIEGLYQ